MVDGTYKTHNPTARICLWYRQGQLNSKPHTAIVLTDDESERGILSLAVFPGGRMFEVYHGVRHADDPNLAKRAAAVKTDGVWDYLPSEKANAKPRNVKKPDA